MRRRYSFLYTCHIRRSIHTDVCTMYVLLIDNIAGSCYCYDISLDQSCSDFNSNVLSIRSIIDNGTFSTLFSSKTK